MSGFRYWAPVAMMTARACTVWPAAEVDSIGKALASQPHRRPRDHELSAELLRLDEGVAREEMPRDSRGEPEIVLDAGARAGLAARRVRLDDEHVEALGGRVDGGREAGGTGPDDDEVADDLLVHLVQAEAIPDLVDGRLLEDPLAAADEDGNVARPRRRSRRASSGPRRPGPRRGRCRAGCCG